MFKNYEGGVHILAKIEDKIEELVEQPINSLGYRVYDVMYVKEGKDNYLKIFIDNAKGIGVDDCEKVNNGITDLLDEADLIKDPYFLEISSPGIERIIRKDKQLEENLNEEIFVKTFSEVDGSKELIGILKKFDKDNITIDINGEDIILERKNIALIKKNYNW